MWWTRCIPIRLRCWNNRSEMGKFSNVLVGLAETITSSSFLCVGHLLPRHHAVATARTAPLPGKLLSKNCFEIRHADVYSIPSHFHNDYRTSSGRSCSPNAHAGGLIGARSKSCWREVSKTALLIAPETRPPKRASPCPVPTNQFYMHLNMFCIGVHVLAFP